MASGTSPLSPGLPALSDPPVAFVCAMPMELRPLSRRLRLRAGAVGGVPARIGRLGDRNVVGIVTGMGPARAAAATDRLLGATAVRRVVVVGITGAVDDMTPIGTLVVPDVVVDGATGAEHTPDRLGPIQPGGVMWTTDRITPPDELPGLRARGVVALDMETAAVAACCARHHVPWSVFRVISDRASDGSVDDEIFRLSNADGTPDAATVARFLLRHPGRIPNLVRLACGANLATRRAAQAAIDAVVGAP